MRNSHAAASSPSQDRQYPEPPAFLANAAGNSGIGLFTGRPGLPRPRLKPPLDGPVAGSGCLLNSGKPRPRSASSAPMAPKAPIFAKFCIIAGSNLPGRTRSLESVLSGSRTRVGGVVGGEVVVVAAGVGVVVVVVVVVVEVVVVVVVRGAVLDMKRPASASSNASNKELLMSNILNFNISGILSGREAQHETN